MDIEIVNNYRSVDLINYTYHGEGLWDFISLESEELVLNVSVVSSLLAWVGYTAPLTSPLTA